MAVKGKMKYVKFLLFFFNVILVLYGLAFLPLGVVINAGAVPESESEYDKTSTTVCIVYGLITMFIAFMGCFGAWKENYCILTTFVVLLSLYLIIEMILFVGTGVVHYHLIHYDLQDMVRNYTTVNESKSLIDSIQQDMQCCGVVNASDWVDFQPDGTSVPDSCCWSISPGCGARALLNSTAIYTEGCKTVMWNNLKELIPMLGILTLLVACIKILSLVLAYILRYGIRKSFYIK